MSQVHSLGAAARHGARLPRRTVWPPIWASVALGAALRVVGLAHKPLWEDEGWTFHVVTAPQNLWTVTGLDPHPLSFYWLMRLLDGLVTTSDWAFRLPAVICSVLAIVLLAAALATFRVDRALQRWCVLLFAVLPLNVIYGQEARAYALVQALGCAALLAYAWARRRPSWPRLFGLALATALSCHLDGFGLVIPFGLLVHAALATLRHRAAQRRLAALLLGGLAAAPYYLLRVLHFTGAGEVHGMPPIRFAPHELLIERFVTLSPFGASRHSLERFGSPELLLVCLAALTATLLLIALVGRTRWLPRGSRGLFLFCLAPALIAYTAACVLTQQDTLEKRYFVPLAPAFVVLFTVGYLRMARVVPLAGYGLCLLVPLAVSTLWLTKPVARSSSDWRTPVRHPRARAAYRTTYSSQSGSRTIHSFSPCRSGPTPIWPAPRSPSRAGTSMLLREDCRQRRLDAPADARCLSAAQQRALLEFLASAADRRVWNLTSELVWHRTLDLSALGESVDERHAPRVDRTALANRPEPCRAGAGHPALGFANIGRLSPVQ